MTFLGSKIIAFSLRDQRLKRQGVKSGEWQNRKNESKPKLHLTVREEQRNKLRL
jgi:hypothetical protein